MMRHLTAGFCASVLLSGCFAGGYYDSSYSSASGASSGSSSSSDTASTTEPSEQSYVDRSGNIVFRKPGETTIVRPDGEVTIIQRDPDGTRTTVDSSGYVSVDPPGRGGRGRKD